MKIRGRSNREDHGERKEKIFTTLKQRDCSEHVKKDCYQDVNKECYEDVKKRLLWRC